MPLKATDIQKKLPEGGKKNCKECGFPTCFAFAMKLSAGTITVDKCPYLSEEVKNEFIENLSPLMRLVTIGEGENALSIGQEEVIYRHEKTFYHPPGIAILVADDEKDEVISKKINKIKELQFDRIGQILKANLVAVKFASNKEKYLNIVKKVIEENIPLVLICEELDLLFEARNLSYEKKPLIYPLTKDNMEKAIPRIKEKPTPIGLKTKGVEEIIPLTLKLKAEGINDIVIDTSPKDLNELIRDYTLIRRTALKKEFRALGYPIISFPCFMTQDKLQEVMFAATDVIKYAGIIVLSDFEKNTLFPLLVLRQNIFTDPRVPLAVEEKIYEFGNVTEESPLLITTNFALTYFAVASEIENSKLPAYLAIKDAEGLCVLAAWSTGKFNGETIAPFIKKSGMETRIKNKRMIIPGLAARIKGELEDELPGWKITVGPREAADIPSFLSTFQ